MSRCYPYPPLGFVKDGGQWIDCIKLQREREKIKTEIQKEKKREKEKRKSDRGKKISTDTGHGKRRKLDYQKCDEQERSKEKSLGAHIQKRIEAEAEQLERSGITDEHEQPTCSINVCSDSLQGSNKSLKLGYKNSLEDDINHLFEAINLKASTKSVVLSQHEGSSPLRKSLLKRPITVGTPRSPGMGNSEPVTLKQALRELCLYKASETAAMKRLSKSTSSPGVSEAGRIKTLYDAVVVEASGSGQSLDDSKGSGVEISIMPKETKSSSSGKMPENLQTLTMNSSSQGSQNSPRFAGITTQNSTGNIAVHSGIISSLCKYVGHTQKIELAKKEKHTSAPSPPSPSASGHLSEPPEKYPAPSNITNKALAPDLVQKDRLKVAPSSSSLVGNRVSKLSRNNSRSVKSVVRNKSSVKKKIKQNPGSAPCTSSSYNSVNNDSNPSKIPAGLQ